MKVRHCGDQRPHGPHTYYEPSSNPKETKQVEVRCPGSPRVPKR